MSESSAPINVLISLHRGYGLGDSVAMSSVLQHVKKYYPEWRLYYQAEEGKECVGNGIAHHIFCYGELPEVHFDKEILVTLFDVWHGFTDKPNTRVTDCLQRHFDLEWDRECARYKLEVSEDASKASKLFIEMIKHRTERNSGVVAVHYQGNTLKDRKNLTNDQAYLICRQISALGRVPLLFDWEDKSALSANTYRNNIKTTGGFSFSKTFGRSAEMNAAIISQCEAFIGIDSGPSKCASATQTPSLVVWTGHHPAMYHDPAENTTHLVPHTYCSLEPVCNNLKVIDWFDANYDIRTYSDNLLEGIECWLKGVLK